VDEWFIAVVGSERKSCMKMSTQRKDEGERKYNDDEEELLKEEGRDSYDYS
jgi:hypothetical protein